MFSLGFKKAFFTSASRVAIAGLVSLPGVMGATSFAQSNDEDEDVITITVERREQSLQDLAGTATSFDGDDMKLLGVQSMADLNGRYPGLQIGNNQGNIEVFIRGVGSTNNTELGEPAASTHMDGIYVPRPSGFGSAFFDIQRVEVNVGPQGTLRGRNATAGSVNVIPWGPGLGVFDVAAEVSVGNYGERSFEGVINVPVSQNSAFRLAGYAMSHDSYYENASPTSADLGVSVPTASSEGIDVAEAADNWGARASFLIEPTPNLTMTFTADYLSEGGTGYTTSAIRAR